MQVANLDHPPNMITYIFYWDNLIGFTHYKIQVTTEHYPFLDR